ncbi:unnamed protein product [Cylicocyclus nassatus]|uniref:Uncharacterized protein n=1 Tax=Cylicocyclus nassatus TaxID=53992 RepID=A0AA36H8P8_CYLNA|nr:unnamed protein product [Cylicocyclus nassatus]
MNILQPPMILLLSLSVIQFIILTQFNWRCAEKADSSRKYVGFRMNKGRFGAQLFHLISGYGIARTLNRTHYLSLQDGYIAHVVKFLRQFKDVFPRLQDTFVLAPYDAPETHVDFIGGCCNFLNPLRLYNNTAEYMFLKFKFGQHPKYFQDYLADIRQILKFSSVVEQTGEKSFRTVWKS